MRSAVQVRQSASRVRPTTAPRAGVMVTKSTVPWIDAATATPTRQSRQRSSARVGHAGCLLPMSKPPVKAGPVTRIRWIVEWSRPFYDGCGNGHMKAMGSGPMPLMENAPKDQMRGVSSLWFIETAGFTWHLCAATERGHDSPWSNDREGVGRFKVGLWNSRLGRCRLSALSGPSGRRS